MKFFFDAAGEEDDSMTVPLTVDDTHITVDSTVITADQTI